MKLLRERYEKHFDLEQERVYYVRKQGIPKTAKKESATKLWDPPPLLRKRYDLGEPVEIQRLARFANMAPDEAARIVQHAYRCHRGREFMRRILRSRIKKLWDATTGRYYYYNATTKESSWEKPRLLLHDGDEVENQDAKVGHGEKNASAQGRRRHAVKLRPEKFSNDESAARTIQALYRRFATRKMMLELLSRRYRKMMDPVSGQAYYYDSVAGTATWFKPAVLGDYDLELFDNSVTTPTSGKRKSTLIAPESSSLSFVAKLPRISERARQKRHKRRLQRLRQMSRDEAASRLQRMWRTRRAKEELRELLFDAYEKIFDPTTEHFYYYNRKTGVAKWEKPALLVGDDRDIKETKIIKRRRSYTVTEPTEAKLVVFTFMRCAAARLELHRLLKERIQKVFDPNSQEYYYFDKLTGQSSWKKPVTLKGYDLTPV
ncbi:E3 ubiquitin protein ligase [Phytophthora cinnamomi]|uniref:E3 ubiquitin protein ligase n=1 Tax=Phytophthora cinnamomi TaxID=4785 RepID=UPI0035599543|nr:E3 ubiquitin protein ligase [Phytophthora cinnamomi]